MAQQAANEVSQLVAGPPSTPRIREEYPPIGRMRGRQQSNPSRLSHRTTKIIAEKVTKFNFGACHNIYIVKFNSDKVNIYLADELTQPGVFSTYKTAELTPAQFKRMCGMFLSGMAAPPEDSQGSGLRHDLGDGLKLVWICKPSHNALHIRQHTDNDNGTEQAWRSGHTMNDKTYQQLYQEIQNLVSKRGNFCWCVINISFSFSEVLFFFLVIRIR